MLQALIGHPKKLKTEDASSPSKKVELIMIFFVLFSTCVRIFSKPL